MMDQGVAHLGPAERRALGFALCPRRRLGRGAVPKCRWPTTACSPPIHLVCCVMDFIDRMKEAEFTAALHQGL